MELKTFADLLKLAHVRERFSRHTQAPVDPFDDEEDQIPFWNGKVPSFRA